MANDAISLVLLALDERRNEIFHMTLVSHQPYEQAVQEIVGIGRVMLKNDREIARVEVHKEKVMPGAFRVVLTREDLSPEEPAAGKPAAHGLSTLLRRLLQL